MLNIILFGPPGAGKGTQAVTLSQDFQLKHLSTGDMLRSEIAKGSALGIEAQHYMSQGNLVPDAVVIGMIDEQLKHLGDAKGVVFDGFPRTTTQAEALDALLVQYTPIKGVLALEVNDNELINRILERAKTSGRVDDTKEVVENRIKVYNTQTAPLIDYYKSQGKYISVKGIGTIEEVRQGLTQAIHKL